MTDTHRLSANSLEDSLRDYDAQIRPARERFAAGRGIRGMISPETDARTIAAFLLHFTALSVPITEPVEGWIRRAGERCAAIELGELGKSLASHSKAEAGHHQYHIDDFAAMVSVWNARWSPTVCPDAITGIGLTRGGQQYCQVHEKNIRGDQPYCQFAIEYEIELLPVVHGSPFLNNCVRLLGQDILRCMTFVTSHIEFDVGHTKFNAHFLGNLIAQEPERLEPLTIAGAAALDAMGAHLSECWDLGVELAQAG